MRRLLLPIIIFGVIGLPLLWNAKNSSTNSTQNQQGYNSGYGMYPGQQGNVFQNASHQAGQFGYGGRPSGMGGTLNPQQLPVQQSTTVQPATNFPPPSSPVSIPPLTGGTVIQGPQNLPPGARRTSVHTTVGPLVNQIPQGHSQSSVGMVPVNPVVGPNLVPAIQASSARTVGPNGEMSGSFITPGAITGSTQTMVLPGSAQGPDLSASPMEFMPTANLSEIFRFDIYPHWVKSRWERVSTSPGEFGLHGLRVPLVTGTNKTDLHGSMTYYFDANQRCQRIAFRGWTGDASQLIGVLQKRFGFTAKPTHWAGLYIQQQKDSVRGAALLQHPAVIRTDNPVQQVAIVLEVNNPQGQFGLSEDVKSMLPAAQKLH